jgi:hypothetical protein
MVSHGGFIAYYRSAAAHAMVIESSSRIRLWLFGMRNSAGQWIIFYGIDGC